MENIYITLFNAITYKQKYELNKALDLVPNININIQENPHIFEENMLYTPSFLHLSCIQNWPYAVEKLLLNGATINDIKDREGRLPLHFIYNKNILAKLLKHGADINTKDNNGETPLHYMSKKMTEDDFTCFEALILNGADINIKDDFSCTPIYNIIHANISGDEQTIYKALIMLIKHGVDLHVKDDYGRLPLYYAIEKDRFLCVKEISKYYNNEEIAKIVNFFGKTAFSKNKSYKYLNDFLLNRKLNKEISAINNINKKQKMF